MASFAHDDDFKTVLLQMKAKPKDPSAQLEGLRAITAAANLSKKSAVATAPHLDLIVAAFAVFSTSNFQVAEAACWALDSLTNGEYEEEDEEEMERGGAHDDDDDDEEDAGADANDDEDDDEDDDEVDDDEDEDEDDEEEEEDDEAANDEKQEEDDAFSVSMAELAARKGAVSSAVAALAKFGAGRLQVAKARCSLMVSLAEALARDDDDDDSPHVLAVGGCPRALVAVLAAHGKTNAPLALTCCRAMAGLTGKCGSLGNTTASAEIVSAGGFELVVSSALVAHGTSDPDVAKYGCRSLYHLLSDADALGESERKSLVARSLVAGAPAAVVACMSAFPEDQESTAGEGCSALYGMSKSSEPGVVRALVDAKSIQAVCRSLMWYGDSETAVAKYGCMALSSLLSSSAVDAVLQKEVVSIIAEEKGIDGVVMALLAHAEEESRVSEECLTTVAILLNAEGGSGHAATFLNEEGSIVPEIVSAMVHHGVENEVVAEYGCRSMVALMVHGGMEAIAQFRAVEGTFASIVDSIQEHGDTMLEIGIYGCRALFFLMDGVESEKENAKNEESKTSASASASASSSPQVGEAVSSKKTSKKTSKKKHHKGGKGKQQQKSKPKDYRTLIAAAGGIQAIVATMQSFGTDEVELVEEGSRALSSLLKMPKNKIIFTGLGVEGSEIFQGLV